MRAKLNGLLVGKICSDLDFAGVMATANDLDQSDESDLEDVEHFEDAFEDTLPGGSGMSIDHAEEMSPSLDSRVEAMMNELGIMKPGWEHHGGKRADGEESEYDGIFGDDD